MSKIDYGETNPPIWDCIAINPTSFNISRRTLSQMAAIIPALPPRPSTGTRTKMKLTEKQFKEHLLRWRNGDSIEYY